MHRVLIGAGAQSLKRAPEKKKVLQYMPGKSRPTFLTLLDIDIKID